MKFNGLMRTGVAMLTLAILALTTFAPAAEAGQGRGNGGNGRRWKDSSSESRGSGWNGGGRTRVIHRSSNSNLGPAIIGFIGGVALGAAISNSHQQDRYYDDRGYGGDGYGGGRTVSRDRGCNDGYGRGDARQADYSYNDPYCEVRFSSFDECRAHERGCNHPRVIQVIAMDGGGCVDTYRYRDGGWHN